MPRRLLLLLAAALSACDLALDFGYYHCQSDGDCPANAQACDLVHHVCSSAAPATSGGTSGSGSSGSGSATSGGVSATGGSTSSITRGSSSGSSSSSGSGSSFGGSTSGSSAGTNGLAPGITLEVVAGAGTAGFQDGPAAIALFSRPYGIGLGNGGLFVSEDGNGSLRFVDLGAMMVSTIVDGGLGSPDSLAVGKGPVYLGDTSGNLFSASTPGQAPVTLYSEEQAGGSGFNNLMPEGLAFDGARTLYVSDQGDYCIGALDLVTLALTPFAGSCDNAQGTSNGAALGGATFNTPSGVAIDSQGNVFVVDQNEDQTGLVREISQGTVTTIAGASCSGCGSDLDGPASQAVFNDLFGIVADSRGNLFLSENFFGGVREIQLLPDGGRWVRSLAFYFAAGNPLHAPEGLALDEDGGALYIADSSGNQIWVMRGLY